MVFNTIFTMCNIDNNNNQSLDNSVRSVSSWAMNNHNEEDEKNEDECLMCLIFVSIIIIQSFMVFEFRNRLFSSDVYGTEKIIPNNKKMSLSIGTEAFVSFHT